MAIAYVVSEGVFASLEHSPYLISSQSELEEVTQENLVVFSVRYQYVFIGII